MQKALPRVVNAIALYIFVFHYSLECHLTIRILTEAITDEELSFSFFLNEHFAVFMTCYAKKISAISL